MPDKTSKSGTPLGPIGTKVLFENEHIRVWSVELPGKGHQPLHEHDHPYLIVPVSEGKALMRWEDGREREIVDVLGNVVYREASGGPHELFNLEDTKIHSILVEIKAAGQAPSSFPPHACRIATSPAATECAGLRPARPAAPTASVRRHRTARGGSWSARPGSD